MDFDVNENLCIRGTWAREQAGAELHILDGRRDELGCADDVDRAEEVRETEHQTSDPR